MKYAIITDGAIENKIEAEEGFSIPGKTLLPIEELVEDTSKSDKVVSINSVKILEDKVVFKTTVQDKSSQDIDAEADAEVLRTIENTVGKVLYKMANEIQVLKGQPTLTPNQFRTYVKNLL